LPPIEVPGLLGRVLGLAVPVVLLGLLALGYAGVERSRVGLEQREARAQRLVVGLAEAARQVGAQRFEQLQPAASALAGAESLLNEFWLITERQVGRFSFQKARTYVIHSDPQLTGQQLDNARERDKRPYDLAQLVETRFSEHGEKRRDLSVVLRPTEDPLTLDVAAPVLDGGRVAGVVGLRVHSPRGNLPLPWLMVFVLMLTATAAGALLFRFVPNDWAQAIGGVVIVLVTGWLMYAQGRAAVDAAEDLATRRTIGDTVALHAALPASVERAAVLEQMSSQPGPGLELVGVKGTPSPGTDPRQIISMAPGALPPVGTASVSGVSVAIRKPSGESSKYRSQLARRDLVSTIAFGLVFLLAFVGWVRRFGLMVKEHAFAYGYAAPAMVGMLLFVFFPFISGFAFSFFEHVSGDDLSNTVVMFDMHFRFKGLQNFWEILASPQYSITDGRNFYFTLLVTIMWTVSNVGLHVGIGLALALVLKNQWLKLKGVYRVLLIIPWAVPNYITALIWRGMFDVEYGTINYLLQALGLGKVAWWDHFWSSFAANLTTNVWLGFPFMMVISLGALQSIPGDLYEAAEVDGASRWQQFRHITLPLLKPALFPAVILGTIWTFNMFNIIYLVSGGAPERKTDILITEAYRWAFEGGRRYGYAAAYSVIIFVILLVYSLFTNRITKASEGAFD